MLLNPWCLFSLPFGTQRELRTTPEGWKCLKSNNALISYIQVKIFPLEIYTNYKVRLIKTIHDALL
jgi:hypothetical protein